MDEDERVAERREDKLAAYAIRNNPQAALDALIDPELRRDPVAEEEEFFETDPFWIVAPAMIGGPDDDDEAPDTLDGLDFEGFPERFPERRAATNNNDDTDDGWGLRTR